MSRLPSQRERGAELNRILRGETKGGIINSWQGALRWGFWLVLGLFCWWSVWLAVKALWRAL